MAEENGNGNGNTTTTSTTMEAPTHHSWHTFIMPMYLVTFGALLIIFGDWKGWSQLGDFGMSAGGAGLGIITQNGASLVQKKTGGGGTLPPPVV